MESILKESDVKLDLVRRKIAQIAEELKGEDIYQFHRAFTAGELKHCPFHHCHDLSMPFLNNVDAHASKSLASYY